MTQLLERITVTTGTQTVRTYQLTYHPGADSRHPSRLQSVTLCSGKNTCLLPVTFDWSGLHAFGFTSDGSSPNEPDDVDDDIDLTDEQFGWSDVTENEQFNEDDANRWGTTAQSTPANNIPSERPSDMSSMLATHLFSPLAWKTEHPRQLGDFDGDGYVDIVGFDEQGMLFAMGSQTVLFHRSHRSAYFKSTQQRTLTGTDGWGALTKEQHAIYPRLLGDVNGDGKTDVVGVGTHVVYVGKGHAKGVSAPKAYLGEQPYEEDLRSSGWTAPNGLLSGYSSDRDLITLGDVNGDGRADIVVFVSSNVYVAYSQGDRFSAFSKKLSAFKGKKVWDKDDHPRYVVDINSDGKGDLLAFGDEGIYVALATTDGFAPAKHVLGGAHENRFKHSQDHPSTLGDVNGDGVIDIVSFNFYGTHVALGKGDGTFLPLTGPYQTGAVIDDFGKHQDWDAQKHTRMLADVNGDGRADVVGFKDAGLYIALAKRLKTYTRVMEASDNEREPDIRTTYNVQALFEAPKFQLRGFGYGSKYGAWRVGEHPRMMADVDGNGSADILGFGRWGVEVTKNQFNGQQPRLISVTDGFGVTTDINYASMRNPTLYTPSSGSIYPTLDMRGGPQYLVSAVRSDDGLGGQLTTKYCYGGMKINMRGRGMLGFAWTETEQVETQTVSRVDTHQAFPYTGLPSKTEQRVKGKLIAQTKNKYKVTTSANGKVHFPYLSESVEKSWAYNGSSTTPTSTVTVTNSDLDDYGNVQTVKVETTGGTTGNTQTYTQTTKATYDNHIDRWHLGRLSEAKVTHTGYGDKQIRHSTFEYHPTTGLLTQETVEPNTDHALTTTYVHDGLGNVENTTLSNATFTHPVTKAGFADRTTQTEFDDIGQFATRSTNALGHSETRSYDARFGGDRNAHWSQSTDYRMAIR
jgi:hypothetical protein